MFLWVFVLLRSSKTWPYAAQGMAANEVLSGWIQVIRGPRPKAERWPMAKKGVPHVSAAAPVPHRPHHRAVATEFGTPRSRRATHGSARQSCEVGEGCRSHGRFDGNRGRGLKAALKRAQVASREAPLAVQDKECESFIERARNRITKLDEERVAEVAELEKAESRLVRLKLQDKSRTTPSRWHFRSSKIAACGGRPPSKIAGGDEGQTDARLWNSAENIFERITSQPVSRTLSSG